jgi:type I restriction enzyme, S subunit
MTPKLRFPEYQGIWTSTSLSTIATLKSGYAFDSKTMKSEEDTFQIIKMSNVYKGRLDLSRNPSYWAVLEDKQKGFILKNGDIIITLTGTVGKRDYGYSIIIDTNRPLLLNQRLLRIREQNDKSCSYFLLNLVRTSRFLHNFFGESNGGTGNQTNVSINSVKAINLYTPSIGEQKKIASFFYLIDQKINLLTKKKEALETYKKGLMQKIFPQELRFKREDGTDYPDWKSIRLGNIVSECKKKSISENEAPVFTSSRRGLLFQTDYFGENRLTERSNVGFNIVPKDYITYRSRSDNRIFTFNQNTLGAEGIISPYYPVFTTTSEYDSYFLMIALNYYSNYIGSFSVGTSQTVLSMSVLKKSILFLPDKEEQLAITSLLKSADKSIATTEKLLTKSIELKKGLLQQMFV